MCGASLLAPSRDFYQDLFQIVWHDWRDVLISTYHNSCFLLNVMNNKIKRTVMPCPFESRKMFCASPNFLSQTKNLFTYGGSYKHFLPEKKMICIQWSWYFCRHKSVWKGTRCSQIFGFAQKIWTSSKHFGTCKRKRHYSSSSLGRSQKFKSFRFILNNRYLLWLKKEKTIL